MGLLVLAAFLYSQAPPTAIPHREILTTQSQVYKLQAVPNLKGAVMVFCNGLLMAPGIDYTLSGSTLTFTAQQIGVSPVIQVFYWTQT